MLVKMDKFIFSVNFVILYIDEEVEVPLILASLILAISKALIDVNDGQMVLWVGDEKVIFKLHPEIWHSSSEDNICFSIDTIDSIISECVQEILEEDL